MAEKEVNEVTPNVLYINGLPTQDEGHPLTWTYYNSDMGNVPVVELTTSYGSWLTKANWADNNVLTDAINLLLLQKRRAWREKLRSEGPVSLQPTPDGPARSVYNYLGKV